MNGLLWLRDRIYYWERICALCVMTTMALHGQTLTTLYAFTSSGETDEGIGAGHMELVQGADGNLYGTTVTNGDGTIFSISPAGSLTTLYSFCAQHNCQDGTNPLGGLILGADGNFYGATAEYGATHYAGTVFKFTSVGGLTTLHRFCREGTTCIDGSTPAAGLVQGTDGNFYGTTTAGGAANGGGTIFKIGPDGSLSTLYFFCAPNCTGGSVPDAALIQGTDGNLYGSTLYGGSYGYGTIFRITPAGRFTTLHNMSPSGGTWPSALVEAANGNFFGTTASGGAYGGGTVFQMTRSGAVKTVYSFCGQPKCADGASPYGRLVAATDGNLYGTTTYGTGTIFRVALNGSLTTLHTFAVTDGENPYNGLVQATDGSFYGTTSSGGAGYFGTVFRLSVDLGPFVKTVPLAGTVGSSVILLGTNLMGATSVTFNGTPAAFAVVSATEITATVPTGATTGKVEVVIPDGTLKSNVKFLVRP
jgi:uncharacterized repeat protein (TIGR03803 family)